jgi:hypothetical protein
VRPSGFPARTLPGWTSPARQLDFGAIRFHEVTVPRKPLDQRREELLTRKRQLEAQLAALDARQKLRDRKRDARRKILVGAAALAHGELNPSFRVALRDALRATITRDHDKVVVADLLD